MLTFISFTTLLAISFALPQYPPSGWRPRGTPFVLPREYLPSSPIKNAVQHEINRERLEYIGQYQIREPFFYVPLNYEQQQPQQQQPQQVQPQQGQFGRQVEERNEIQSQPGQQIQPQQQQQPQTQPQPHTTYLTPAPDNSFQVPTTTEYAFEDTTFFSTTEFPTTSAPPSSTENFLRVQGLPSLQAPVQFQDPNKRVQPLNQNFIAKSGQLRQQPQPQRANLKAEAVPARQQQQQSPKGQFAFVNTAAEGAPKSGKQIAVAQPEVVPAVQNTYGAPQIAAQPVPRVLLTPVQVLNTYGPPTQVDQPQLPKNDVENNKSTENSDESDEQEQQQQVGNDNENDNNGNNDDDANVNDNGQSNIAIANSVTTNQGQYYILNPDNTLQRVMFMTQPNEENAGFTARLSYMPVEPIRDPIYAYNDKGQLVRVFRK